MVSKASEDLPEPLTPVTTVIWFIGIENEMFLRLLTRAPRTSIASWVMAYKTEPLASTVKNPAAAANHYDNSKARRTRNAEDKSKVKRQAEEGKSEDSASRADFDFLIHAFRRACTLSF